MVVFFNCASKVAFTNDLIDEYDLSDEDIKNTQFFISDKILLQREYDQVDELKVKSSHILESIKGKTIESVIFPPKTPCIIESVIDNHNFLLRFESEDNSVLLFKNIFDNENNTDGLYRFNETVVSYQNNDYNNAKRVDISSGFHIISRIGMGSHFSGFALSLGGSLGYGSNSLGSISTDVTWLRNNPYGFAGMLVYEKPYLGFFLQGGIGVTSVDWRTWDEYEEDQIGSYYAVDFGFRLGIGYEFLIGEHFVLKPSYELNLAFDTPNASFGVFSINFGLKNLVKKINTNNTPLLLVKKSDLKKMENIHRYVKGQKF